MKGKLWFKTKPPKYKLGQWISTVVVSCCYFTSGMALAWTSPAFSKILHKKVDFTLNQYEMSLIAAIPFAGRFFSPLPMSYLMDFIGPKRCLFYGRILQMAHWIMIYFFHNVWVIYSARLLNGWYAGMALFVLPVYVGETTYKMNRGRAQGVMNVLFLLGIVFESAVGSTVSYDNLVLVSGSLDLFFLIFMVIIPDSPYYYMRHGMVEEASLSLQWLRGREENISKELRKIEKHMKDQLTRKSRYIDIFREKAPRKAFGVVTSLMLIQRTSGMTTIIPYGSFVVPETTWLPAVHGTILLNSSYLIMCAVSGFFIDSWGRKNFLVLSSSGTFVFLVGCTIWYYLRDNYRYDVSGTEWIVICFLVIQAGFYSTGYFYVPTLVMSELFPMNIKAKANALGAMFAVAVSAVIVYIFIPITNAYGLYLNFVIYCISNLFGAIYSSTIIETKGKSLEAIQALLEGRHYTSDSTIGLAAEQNENKN